MPSTMNLTGERRGSASGDSAESGLGDFDSSSITSSILTITFSHLDEASQVPDPSGCPTRSSGWIIAYHLHPVTGRPCRYFGALGWRRLTPSGRRLDLTGPERAYSVAVAV